ncbi:MAG: hypothetical protein ABI478_11410 [Propionivibrio sp.]
MLLALGTAPWIFTFWGNEFHPRDAALLERLKQVSPVLTRRTTMWNAWVGFNASHSYGAMLFGLVYGYLALAQPGVLFGSPFLLSVGALFLAELLFLCKRYWFSTPLRGVLLASVLYAAALIVRWT